MSPTGKKIPFKQALESLEPEDVWKNCFSLTQISRSSQHEEKVREFLVQFSQDLVLETLLTRLAMC
ncbi:MAG: hypothetical protein WBD56_08680 [Anaerolineales bacterium]